MPSPRDLLQRFRPAGAPGAATATGVPADRLEEREAELGPVFALLDDAAAEAARIRRDAAAEAERRRQRGRSAAVARVAAARLDAAAIRAEMLARAQQEARTTALESVEAARAAAEAIADDARRTLDADLAGVLDRVRLVLATGSEGPSP